MIKDKLLGMLKKLPQVNKRKALYVVAALLLLSSFIPRHHKPYIDKNLPALSTMYIESKEEKLNPIIQLFVNDQFYCSAFVIGNNYAVTAAHCLVDESYDKLEGDIDIRLENVPTGVKAKAVGVEFRRDLGLIKGDFSRFKMVRLLNDAPGVYPLLYTCGYPGGNKHLSCSTFQPVTNDGFCLKGIGLVQPGMSGGPVVEPQSDTVVGIVTHAYFVAQGNGGVGVASTWGILGVFGIEP